LIDTLTDRHQLFRATACMDAERVKQWKASTTVDPTCSTIIRARPILRRTDVFWPAIGTNRYHGDDGLVLPVTPHIRGG